MSKKNANEGLGRALVRQHRKHVADAKSRASAASKRVVESVIDVKDIDAIIEEAERAGHLYSDSNPIPQLIKLDLNSSNNELTTEEFRRQQKAEEALYKDVIRVPRRPPWHSQMSAEQLDAHERPAFLEWRRSLARLEENEKLILTPFEKNIEIWRQLWRVLERSDLIVTVVDARNPLFYRCPDLEAYAKEIDSHKKTMLLVNKADLLPVHIRKQWATYFRSQGILYVYWSAKTASAILEGKNFEVIAESVETTGSQSSDVIDEDLKMHSREELLNCLQKEAEAISMARKISSRSHVECQDMEENSIVTGNGSVTLPNGMSERVVVGFVGYPNVGKSSTINALVGQKRTGVTSTPGKTKHFQTLIISDKLMLCDCPGLVFPSFSSSRHEMVTLGVLPIDRMTDHRGAIQIVADKVPRVTLESTYNIKLPKPKSFELQSRPPAAFELLRAYSQSRGYVGSGGLPDETRAARQILKDYIDGRLPHYELPPVQYSSTEAGPLLDELQNGGPSSEPEEASVQSKKHLEPKFVSEESESECSEESASEVESKGKLLHVMDSSTLEGVFDELDSFDQTDKRLSSTLKKERVRPLHKLHKKQPRRKDRSWRVGNDDGDGMPTSKAIQKPVSYGAAKVKI